MFGAARILGQGQLTLEKMSNGAVVTLRSASFLFIIVIRVGRIADLFLCGITICSVEFFKMLLVTIFVRHVADRKSAGCIEEKNETDGLRCSHPFCIKLQQRQRRFRKGSGMQDLRENNDR